MEEDQQRAAAAHGEAHGVNALQQDQRRCFQSGLAPGGSRISSSQSMGNASESRQSAPQHEAARLDAHTGTAGRPGDSWAGRTHRGDIARLRCRPFRAAQQAVKRGERHGPATASGPWSVFRGRRVMQDSRRSACSRVGGPRRVPGRPVSSSGSQYFPATRRAQSEEDGGRAYLNSPSPLPGLAVRCCRC